MYYVIQHVIRKVLVTCCTRATWCSWWIWKGPFGSRFCEGFRHVKHYRCREDEFLNESTSPGRVYPPGCQSPTRIVIFSRGISIKKRLHLPLLDAESIRQVYGKYVETTRSFHLQNNWGVKNMQLISPIRGWNHDLITRMSFRHQSPRVVCPFWKAKFTNWALNFASQYRVVCCWRFFQLEQFVVFFGWWKIKVDFLWRWKIDRNKPMFLVLKFFKKEVPTNFSVFGHLFQDTKTTKIHTNDVCGLSGTSARRLGRLGKASGVLTGVIFDNHLKNWIWLNLECYAPAPDLCSKISRFFNIMILEEKM